MSSLPFHVFRELLPGILWFRGAGKNPGVHAPIVPTAEQSVLREPEHFVLGQSMDEIHFDLSEKTGGGNQGEG